MRSVSARQGQLPRQALVPGSSSHRAGWHIAGRALVALLLAPPAAFSQTLPVTGGGVAPIPIAAASPPEQVPALGESQIGFLDALRSDRRIAVSPVVDRQFRDRVREAVSRHPEFQTAMAAREGARGATEESRAALRPQVTGQTDGGWRSFDQNRLFGVPERRYTSAGWGLVLRQLVFDFGAAEAVVVAPMQYSQIVWAVFYGALFFEESPDAITLVGAAVVMGSGIYILLREQKLHGAPVAPAAPASTAGVGLRPRR